MILVSGGTGLVGAHLLLDLCKKGVRTRAIYRSVESLEGVTALFNHSSKEGAPLFAQIEWVPGDVLDTESLKDAFNGIDQVFHCAALISFDPNDIEKLYKTNVIGTANMVNTALVFEVSKFCYVSSIASIGKSLKKEITEETPWNIEDPNVYAQSKYLAELEVWRGVQEGLNAVIINPGVILGSGFWNRGSGALFAFANKNWGLYFPGGTAFVGVKDVVKCMQLAMIENPVKPQRYICVSENLSYQTLFKYMAIGFGKKPPNREVPLFLLNIIWRLDFLRQKIFGGPRKISKQTVRGLGQRDYYSSKKSREQLGLSYEKIADVVLACCKNFQIKKP